MEKRERYIEKVYTLDNQPNKLHVKKVRYESGSFLGIDEYNLISIRLFDKVSEQNDRSLKVRSENYTPMVYLGKKMRISDFLDLNKNSQEYENLKGQLNNGRYVCLYPNDVVIPIEKAVVTLSDLDVYTKTFAEKIYIKNRGLDTFTIQTSNIQHVMNYENGEFVSFNFADEPKNYVGIRFFERVFVEIGGELYPIGDRDYSKTAWFGKSRTINDIIRLSANNPNYLNILKVMTDNGYKEVVELAYHKFVPLNANNIIYDVDLLNRKDKRKEFK